MAGSPGRPPALQVEVVKRSDDIQGFAVFPRRWVVERAFGYLAMIRLQLRRLA